MEDSELRQLHTEINTLKKQNDDKSNIIEKLNYTIKSNENEYNMLNSINNHLENENQTILQQIRGNYEITRNINNELDNLKLEKEYINIDHNDEIKKLQDEINDLRQSNDTLIINLDTATDRLDNLTNEYETLTNKFNEKKKKLEKYKNNVIALHADNDIATDEIIKQKENKILKATKVIK